MRSAEVRELLNRDAAMKPFTTIKRSGRIRFGMLAFSIMAISFFMTFKAGEFSSSKEQNAQLEWCMTTVDFIKGSKK